MQVSQYCFSLQKKPPMIYKSIDIIRKSDLFVETKLWYNFRKNYKEQVYGGYFFFNSCVFIFTYF